MQIHQISQEILGRLQERASGNDAALRYERISQVMTPEWRRNMDSQLKDIMQSNASLRSKLPRITALMDDVHKVRQPHVACKSGCNACCYMMVEISSVEAERIGSAIGRQPARLPPGRQTAHMDEFGRPDTPCPFLVEGECSIYEQRPVVCRDLAVAAPDALACSFENMALAREDDPRAIPVPQTQMEPIIRAWAVAVQRPGWTFADIRQFFPSKT